MWDNLAPYSIVLASQSPRRRELLRGLDLCFEVDTDFAVDEHIDERLGQCSPQDIVIALARRKAHAYPRLTERTLLITADTLVVAPSGEILGKPESRADAERMLSLLSGGTHSVTTGVCLRSMGREEAFASTTLVHFAPLSEQIISYYIDRYEPYDKAGAYGIQEWIGYRAITGLEGSYYNVMGLPVHQLAERLVRW